MKKVDIHFERRWTGWYWTITRDGKQSSPNRAWTRRGALKDAVGLSTVLLNTTQAQQILDADG
jgi:hypothetical protein